MPLRPLQHELVETQTPSSSLKSILDERHIVPDVRPGAPSGILDRSNCVSVLKLQPDYFDSIDEIRRWANLVAATGSRGDPNPGKFDGPLRGDPKFCSTSDGTSKLLVCHDFKGGYTEDPIDRGYSFEFWHLIDIFIYFSHKRVTIPPQGWIDTGHRHGSKVFGTVIFEWSESKPDLEQCLYGGDRLGVEHVISNSESSFSTIYASHLITLAQARNFEGYLLNIETDLNFLPPASFYPQGSQSERDEDATFLERESHLSGLEALISSEIQRRRAHRMEMNARALLGWVGWLREEGKRRLGPHWEIIWYDSVTTTGQLRWQDALTLANAPFFMNSDAIFTNYTWARPPDPAPPGALQETEPPQTEHHPALRLSASIAETLGRSADGVYIGIDVFGRNCYGGFDIGRSLDMIFPSLRLKQFDGSGGLAGEGKNLGDLGLSVALFAPGWTWEREMAGGGERSWSEWWEDELLFWVGRAAAEEPTTNQDAPVSSFFRPRERFIRRALRAPATSRPTPKVESLGGNEFNSRSHPPSFVIHNRRRLLPTFYTNFNRGSGTSWWVRGRKVYDASLSANDLAKRRGWTDIGSCFPKPDRIWPQPVGLRLEGGYQKENTDPLTSLICNENIYVQAALTGDEAWDGGTSLELVFHQKMDSHHSPPAGFTTPSLTVIPLCTLDACHLTLSEPRDYALSVVVKSVRSLAEITSFREVGLRPYLLWTDIQPGGRGSYKLSSPHTESDQVEIHNLENGWYNITVVVPQETTEAQTIGRVPVIALGLEFPFARSGRILTVSPELRINLGAISFSAFPQSLPDPSSRSTGLVSPVADSTPQTSSDRSTDTLNWKPVPRPLPASPSSLWGVLTWSHQEATSSEDYHSSADDLSGYFNVFASVLGTKEVPGGSDIVHHPQEDVWLGTSTYEYDRRSFVIAGLEPSDLFPLKADTTLEIHTHSDASLRDEHFGDKSLSVGWPNKVCFKVERVGLGFTGNYREGKGRRYECEVEPRRAI